MADPPLSWAPCLVFWVMVLLALSWEPSCALTIAVHFKTPPIPEAPLAQGAFPSLLCGLQNALLVLSLCARGFFSFSFFRRVPSSSVFQSIFDSLTNSEAAP